MSVMHFGNSQQDFCAIKSSRNTVTLSMTYKASGELIRELKLFQKTFTRMSKTSTYS